MWVMKIPTYCIVYYIASALILGLDIFVAFSLRDQLIHFFSQFVLPIQNPKYRQDIFARVRDFESGQPWTCVIRQEWTGDHARGRSKQTRSRPDRSGYRQRARPADRHRDHGHCRAGHQIHERNEYIAGSVDLRAQWQFIGPLATDQPFLNPVPISSPKEYNETQGRRQQTSGLTRDGFEVSPTISIQFSIKRLLKNSQPKAA